MPLDQEKPGLKELIQRFEQQGSLTKKELIDEFQFSYDKINKWASGSSLRLMKVENDRYKLGPAIELDYRIKTPYGELRRDLKQFYPNTYVPETVWQADLKERFSNLARQQSLLMEARFDSNNQYHLDFLPARYNRIIEGNGEYHQVVFDHSRDISYHQRLINARVAEGQGNWELAEYHRTLTFRHEPHEAMVAKVVDHARQQSSQAAHEWRIFALSEDYHKLDRPHLPHSFFQDKKGKETPFNPLKETHFDPKTKTLFFGSDYLDKSIPQTRYREILLDTLQSSGKTLSAVTAITFKRILPAVAVGISIDQVAKAEDKVNAAAQETTKHAGSLTGATLGAAQGLAFGPFTALAGGAIGGIIGWEGSDWLYQRNKEFWQKFFTPSPSPTAGISTPPLIVKDFSISEEPAITDEMIYAKLMPYFQPTTLTTQHPSVDQQQNKEKVSTQQRSSAREIDLEDLSDIAKKIFTARSDIELQQAYLLLCSIDEAELTESDRWVLGYLSDHFAYHTKAQFSPSNHASINLEQIYLIDSAGRAGIELAKIAFTMGNPELGTFLSLSGSLAQGMSSGILFMQSTGGLAMGHFTGVLSALSSIISLFAEDEDNHMQQIFAAFQQIFQEIQKFRVELHDLSQYVVQFRRDLFELLNIYIGTLMSRLFYQEEIIRNGFSEMRYEFMVTRDLSEEILKQLDDEVIYKARDFFENARNISALSRSEVEDLLTALFLRLDKSSSNYKSGVTICQAQNKYGSLAAMEDIVSIIESPAKRGQLAGYLACYYQIKNLSSYLNMTHYPTHIINHITWHELVKFYLHARRTPVAKYYDQDLTRLFKINQQGLDYIDFVEAQRKQLPNILLHLFKEIDSVLNLTISSFEYPELAREFLTKDLAMPQPVIDVLNKYPEARHHKKAIISNELVALARVGVGSFITRNEKGCPSGPINGDLYGMIEEDLVKELHFPRVKKMNYLPDIKNGKDSNPWHYESSVLFNTSSGRVLRLALTEFHDSLYNPGWGQHVRAPCKIRGSHHADVVAEGEQLFLQQRRNFSEIQAISLEKTLPKYREELSSLLLHIQAILQLVGLNEKVANALPILRFPEEITPWIFVYREDKHHKDLYRPWPKPVQVVETLRNFSQEILNFSTLLIGFINNYTDSIVFNNSDMYLTLNGLIDINKFHMEVLLANKTKDSDSPITASTLSNDDKISSSSVGEIIQSKKEQQLMLLIKQNEGLLKQNEELLRQNSELIEIIRKPPRFHVEATLFYDIETIIAQWVPRLISGVSDERTYQHPDNDFHYAIVRRLNNNWETISNRNIVCRSEQDVSYCIGDDVEYTEYRQAMPAAFAPSTQSLLLNAAFNGAIFSVIPEAVGDILCLYQVVSRKKAKQIQWWIHFSMTLHMSGPIGLLSFFISATTMYLFQATGLQESNARIMSNAATFIVSFFMMTRHLTTATGVMLTTTHLLSAKIGLFAEKQAIKMLRQSCQPIKASRETEQKTTALSRNMR